MPRLAMRTPHHCRQGLPRVADAAVGSATLGAGGLRGWADQVQRLITDEPCDLGGRAPFAGWWLEFAGQGVPVHGDLTFAFAASDEQVQALYRHEQLKRLTQLHGDP